jgi:glutamate-1-semialdehyde 2,1-aminomutase
VFGEEPLVDFRSTFSLDMERARHFSAKMLLDGVYCFPKGRGLWYLSTAHTDEDIEEALEAADQVIALLG